jgi:hypothetical protein
MLHHRRRTRCSCLSGETCVKNGRLRFLTSWFQTPFPRKLFSLIRQKGVFMDALPWALIHDNISDSTICSNEARDIWSQRREQAGVAGAQEAARLDSGWLVWEEHEGCHPASLGVSGGSTQMRMVNNIVKEQFVNHWYVLDMETPIRFRTSDLCVAQCICSIWIISIQYSLFNAFY